MSAKHSPYLRLGSPPYPYETRENPKFTAWVERRAVDLCTDTEVGHCGRHITGIPCFDHLRAARRDGFNAWDLPTVQGEVGQQSTGP